MELPAEPLPVSIGVKLPGGRALLSINPSPPPPLKPESKSQNLVYLPINLNRTVSKLPCLFLAKITSPTPVTGLPSSSSVRHNTLDDTRILPDRHPAQSSLTPSNLTVVVFYLLL